MSWQAVCDWATKEWFGVFCLIVGVLLSIYFYFIGKRERRPYYFLKSNNIVKKAHEMIPGLKLHFAGYGEDLFDFTVTKLVFWNKGRETIRKEDVASADPIKVNANDGALILSASILFQSNAANQFRCVVNKEKSAATLAFDYLDHGQCVVLEIAHTGTKKEDISLSGLVKGAPSGGKIKHVRGTHVPLNTSNRRRRVIWIIRGMTALISIGLAVSFFISSRQYNLDKSKFAAKQLEWKTDEMAITMMMLSATEVRDESAGFQKIVKRVSEFVEKSAPVAPPSPSKAPWLVNLCLLLVLMGQTYWLGRRLVPKEADTYF
jgi:hypothetical protein